MPGTDSTPPADAQSPAANADRHGPCRLDRYVSVHETVLEQFRTEGFVNGDTLAFLDFGPFLELAGEIGCAGRIVVKVWKRLEYSGEGDIPFVRTVRYSYHVSVQHAGSLFRYDDAHPYPGHADAHHRHQYGWPNPGQVDGSPAWVGAARWPTLGEVIREAADWRAANRDRLDHPDDFPTTLAPADQIRGG